MALLRETLKSLNPTLFRLLTPTTRHFTSLAAAAESESPSFSFSNDDKIDIKGPKSPSSSVTMPISFMTGSIVGRRFYDKVTTREADDGVGWSVMLDYRTLKTPAKRNLKCPTLALAKAIAAEWSYQQQDGIRPFTMPLMKLACTALERVPVVRQKIIDDLMKKFPQDLVFCRVPKESDVTGNLRERQVEKFGLLLRWLESEFGYRPAVYTSLFGGKQEEGLVTAMGNLLKKTDDCELAAIDAIASASHSLTIAIAVVREQLSIEQAIELIRLEEDLQVDRWGLVEGGHDIDIADLRVQVSAPIVFLGLTRKH